MKKRIMSLVLALVMCVGLVVPAFASEVVCEGPLDSSDREVIYDSMQAHILQESHARDANPPKNMFNLNGAVYSLDGEFDTSVYTNYYFYPNADGRLCYNVTFKWSATEHGMATQRSAHVDCWDKTLNKLVASSIDFPLELNDYGLYGPTVKTGARNFYNLDPTHQYYLRFVKTPDGFLATVKGTIYA